MTERLTNCNCESRNFLRDVAVPVLIPKGLLYYVENTEIATPDQSVMARK